MSGWEKNPLVKLKTHSSELSLLSSLTGKDLFNELEKALELFSKHLGDQEFEFLNSDEFQSGFLAPAIRTTAHWIEKNPALVLLIFDLNILQSEFGKTGAKLAQYLKFIPAVSERAAALFPSIREQTYNALFQLSTADRESLSAFADLLMKSLFHQFALPRLSHMLEKDPRGKVILPFLGDVLKLIPREASLNAMVATLCTPRSQLTPSKFISIAIQELGGLYLKTAQVRENDIQHSTSVSAETSTTCFR